MNFFEPIGNINNFADVIKYICIIAYTYYTSLKIINRTDYIIEYKIRTIADICIVSIIYIVIRSNTNFLYSILFLIILLSVIFSIKMKNSIIDTFINVIISLSINYVLVFIAICVTYLVNYLFKIDNDFTRVLFIIPIYTLFLYLLTNIKRFKNGFSFLPKTIVNEYFELLILNIGVIILFLIIMLPNRNVLKVSRVMLGIIIFGIIMFFTIKKSLELYYKQNLLIKDLEETKKELEVKKQEVEQLEKENLDFSEKSHSLAHKQKSLEYKLNKLIEQGKIEESKEVKDRIGNIAEELYKEPTNLELPKTDIEVIDDMLEYMQSECVKNKIDFELQINGNIHYMVNNYVTKEELEILLADHIKDAIIAINHSDNINRSIFVRIGKIDEIYSIYIYDSGIEFEKETLENLGKKPITTHADEGGTGMGFMNTFKTLKEHNASLIIKEINRPNKEDYTKVIMIKFDGKQEFEIESYRQELNNKQTI